MSGLAELVEELAVWTRDGEHEGAPLLQQLREAVWGNTGRTKGGASAARERIPLDVGAFELWEDISGQIGSQFSSATDLRPNAAPEVNLLAWWAVFSAAMYRQETVLLQHEVAGERLESWAARIRAYFLQPRTRELTVACPVCGRDRVVVGSDVMATEVFALQALVVDGEISVMCQNPACGAVWSGDTAVINLGRQAGVELDVEAIRDSRSPMIIEAKYADVTVDLEPADISQGIRGIYTSSLGLEGLDASLEVVLMGLEDGGWWFYLPASWPYEPWRGSTRWFTQEGAQFVPTVWPDTPQTP